MPVGESRPFRLYTHCGIDFRVDFDGSFWQSYVGAGPNTIGIVGLSMARGMMTLITEDVATFETLDGETTIYFVRNDSPKPTGVCF